MLSIVFFCLCIGQAWVSALYFVRFCADRLRPYEVRYSGRHAGLPLQYAKDETINVEMP